MSAEQDKNRESSIVPPQQESVDDLSADERLAKELEELRFSTKVLEELAFRLERSRVNEYVAILGNPRLLIRRNLLAGMARGIGFSIGFFLLTAVAVYILNSIVNANIPIIGDFIADILTYVDQVREIHP